MKKEHWLLIAAGTGGALIWILISCFPVGKKRGIRSCTFRSACRLSVCLLRCWVSGAEANLALGCALAGSFSDADGGAWQLLPLGLIVFGVLAIPPILLARAWALISETASRTPNRSNWGVGRLLRGWLVARALQ